MGEDAGENESYGCQGVPIEEESGGLGQVHRTAVQLQCHERVSLVFVPHVNILFYLDILQTSLCPPAQILRQYLTHIDHMTDSADFNVLLINNFNERSYQQWQQLFILK